jgi:hypothetical protein
MKLAVLKLESIPPPVSVEPAGQAGVVTLIVEFDAAKLIAAVRDCAGLRDDRGSYHFCARWLELHFECARMCGGIPQSERRLSVGQFQLNHPRDCERRLRLPGL